jgi:hypothetical protein
MNWRGCGRKHLSPNFYYYFGWQLPEGTEESHEISSQEVPWQRFELNTS